MKVGDIVQYFDDDKKFRVGKVIKVGRKWITIITGNNDKVKMLEEKLELYSEYQERIKEEAEKKGRKKK